MPLYAVVNSKDEIQYNRSFKEEYRAQHNLPRYALKIAYARITETYDRKYAHRMDDYMEYLKGMDEVRERLATFDSDPEAWLKPMQSYWGNYYTSGVVRRHENDPYPLSDPRNAFHDAERKSLEEGIRRQQDFLERAQRHNDLSDQEIAAFIQLVADIEADLRVAEVKLTVA